MYFQAIGRDAGVIVYRCPHKHKTAEAAERCGHKQFVWVEQGQLQINSLWWNGGVEQIGGKPPAQTSCPRYWLHDEDIGCMTDADIADIMAAYRQNRAAPYDPAAYQSPYGR